MSNASLVRADITAILNPEIYSQDFIPNTMITLEPGMLMQNVEIDGSIDSCWTGQISFQNFTEYQPSENRRPTALTAGYLAYDAGNLYVVFLCQDPDIKQVRASLADRDKIYDDDWVCVSIDPDNDRQKAYEFFVNARGIQGDRLWQANGNEDTGYDLVWEADAGIYDSYWVAEMKIPFESLRFPNREEQNWSVHFIRHYPRDNEYRFSWMPISANNNSFMGQAGNIQFVLPYTDMNRRTLEILPYAIATQQGYRIMNPSQGEIGTWSNERPDARAGFGIKYSMSTNLITDFTYNPDFSQIESDAGQVSINNPFALFFDERRPFFQEGSDIYMVDQNSVAGIAIDQYVNFFYSRSINDPMMAGKVSARFGRASVGYTLAYDRSTPFLIPLEERTVVLGTDQDSYSNILRARYDLGNQSTIGMMFTDRRLARDGTNSVGSVDASIRLSEKYTLSGIAALTYTRESYDPELSAMIGDDKFEVHHQVKTAAFDGESFYGSVLRAKLNRNSLHWVGSLAVEDFSPGFRADNGFFQANSFRMVEYVGGYNFRFVNDRWFNFIRPTLGVWRKYNYDGVVKDTGIRISSVLSLTRQTTVNMAAFLFNRENLYGKQFDDARSAWIYITNNNFNQLSGYFLVRAGQEINRLGVVGDPHNPFELVSSLSVNSGLTFKPTARITDQIDYQYYQLWTDFGEDKIRGQNILRNTFSYQFSKRMFVRLIGDYNIVTFYSSPLERMVRQNYFSLEPMLSYKLNAFSVFYLGGHLGGQSSVYLDWPEIRVTGESVYLKVQYLFQSW